MANDWKIEFRKQAFEEIRRLSDVDIELRKRVDGALSNLNDGQHGTYEGGVEPGKTRSRGYVVTADAEAMVDNSKNHSLVKELGRMS